jgi:flagellar motor switch protein FliN/FliY
MTMSGPVTEGEAMTPDEAAGLTGGLLPDALLDVEVRVWAEIGRTRMPLAEAMTLGAGAVIDLDRAHDEQVHLFVNGLHYATGHLVTVDGEWALSIHDVSAQGSEVERMSSDR